MSVTSESSGTFFIRILLLLLGTILIVPAVNTIYTYMDYRFFGTAVTGYIDHPSASRDIGGKPIIQYRDAAGNLHEFKSTAKTHWFYSPKKGAPIQVFIHRKNPEKAIVNSLFHYVVLPFIFFFAGCYCCFYGIWPQKQRAGIPAATGAH